MYESLGAPGGNQIANDSLRRCIGDLSFGVGVPPQYCLFEVARVPLGCSASEDLGSSLQGSVG